MMGYRHKSLDVRPYCNQPYDRFCGKARLRFAVPVGAGGAECGPDTIGPAATCRRRAYAHRSPERVSRHRLLRDCSFDRGYRLVSAWEAQGEAGPSPSVPSLVGTGLLCAADRECVREIRDEVL